MRIWRETWALEKRRWHLALTDGWWYMQFCVSFCSSEREEFSVLVYFKKSKTENLLKLFSDRDKCSITKSDHIWLNTCYGSYNLRSVRVLVCALWRVCWDSLYYGAVIWWQVAIFAVVIMCSWEIKHMEITCHYTCDTRKLIVIPYEKLEDQLGYKSPNF